jgi:integrase
MKQTTRKRSMDGTPWLQLNKLGYWTINHPGAGPNGRALIRSLKTSDEKVAQSALSAYIDKLSADKSGPTLETVGDILDCYEKHHVDTKVTDSQRRKVSIAWLKASLGKLPAANLPPLTFLTYEANRSNGSAPVYPGYPSHRLDVSKCAAKGTIRQELSLLRTAYLFAVENAGYNPAGVPRIKVPAQPAPKDLWLDEEEAAWLLRFVQVEEPETGRMSRLWRFVWLLLGTSARKSAVLGLTWAQVDFKIGRINFQAARTVDTRNESATKRKVSVAIADWLLPMLERARDEDVGQPWVLDVDTELQSQFRTLQQDAFKATDNPKFLSMTPHTLRHTAATLMARSGVDLWRVAGVLGNSAAVVEKTYAHHCPDHLRTAVNAWKPVLKHPEVSPLLD